MRGLRLASVLLLIVVSGAALRLGAQSASASLAPATMTRVGSVDERFQSYNIEMIEVTGGRFWKPYASATAAGAAVPAPAPAAPSGSAMPALPADLYEYRSPIDLTNGRLRKLAAALGPVYVRVSGTWANSVYFHDSDEAAPKDPPTGFNGVLTRKAWKGVIDFARAANARIMTSFAISAGTRDTAGAWTADQARRFVAFTKASGGHIDAAEFMNEPTFAAIGGAPKDYDAAAVAKDVAAFRTFFKGVASDALFLGPGSVGEGGVLEGAPTPGRLKTADLLKATGPAFDVFTYHIYPAVSQRCARGMPAIGTTEAAALTSDWLARPEKIAAFYADLRDRFLPGKPLWVNETADTACGGNPWASTFTDTFRYLNQLGSLARQGVQLIAHNTLAASDYGLIDEHTLTPRPNYWAAVLWKRLMGRGVLNPGVTPAGDVHLYAHCMPDQKGGVTVLAINAGKASQELDVPINGERYTLTASELESRTIQLNGHDLQAASDGSLPRLSGSAVRVGRVTLAPTSITFLALPKAGNTACQ
jgi:heparanase